MVAISLLCCNSFSLALKLPSPPPAPPRNSLISRRHTLFRPITISAQSSRLQGTPILTVEMQQSSSTNKSTTEPLSQEDTKKISSSGENTLASMKNSGLNLGQFFTLVNIPTWAKLVMGSVFLLAIPILRKFHRIKDVTEMAEEMAEVVEKVAEATEKAAEEIAEALPEGRIKEAALKLDKIALLVDKEAEFTESIIDKVDDVIEVVDTNLKLVKEEITKKNDVQDKMSTTKKIMTANSKENLQ